jgi:hemerythrin superfamily protein
MARQKRSTTSQESGARGRTRAGESAGAASNRRSATTILIDDHENVRELLRQALQTQDVSRQMELLAQIRRELEIHSRVEEHVFYPALERLGGDWPDRLDEYRRDHHEVRAMLRELVSPDIENDEDDDVDSRIEEITEAIDAHTSDEEERAFPVAEERLGVEEMKSIKARMVELREMLEAAADEDLEDEDLEADVSEGRDDEPLPR